MAQETNLAITGEGTNGNTKQKKLVIVVGGGFAGLQLIRHLDASLYNILLIDKINHHQFQPLFYQVAAAQLEPSSISFPFRKIFQHKKNLSIRMAEVLSLDKTANSIDTTIGSFTYDYLVMATGCISNFFGNAEMEQNALTLKTTADAITIRNNFIRNFETIASLDHAYVESLYNIVIVGAGPTGVEMAGAFAEMKKNVLPKDYPGIDADRIRIYLIEGNKYTLSNMSELAQSSSRQYLHQLGVELKTEVLVKSYDGQTVTLSNGEKIETATFIWTGGVKGNLISGIDPAVVTKANRVTVDRYNLVSGYDNVFAIGDLANMATPKYPNGHPQLANVAINQAKYLAANLNARATGKKQKEFEYKDLGSMATIGKFKAVVDLPKWSFKGFFAWVVWMFLHLMLILSVRNKLIIFINWMWNFFTNDTSLRLILTPSKNKATVNQQ